MVDKENGSTLNKDLGHFYTLIEKKKHKEVKRYQSRINQYQQNCTFKNNQGKFYRELNSEGSNYKTAEVTDKKQAQEFWGSIWGERKDHQKDVEWLENFNR